MAKDKNGSKIRLYVFLLSVAGMIFAVGGTWKMYGKGIGENKTAIKVNVTSIKDLDEKTAKSDKDIGDEAEESCEEIEKKVESQHEQFIGMGKDIEYIKIAQEASVKDRYDIKKEMKEGFEKIEADQKAGFDKIMQKLEK